MQCVTHDIKTSSNGVHVKVGNNFERVFFRILVLDHFTVMCLVALPSNETEGGGDHLTAYLM